MPIKGKRWEMTLSLTEKEKEYADGLLKPLYEKEAAVFQKLNAADRRMIEALKKLVSLLREGA